MSRRWRCRLQRTFFGLNHEYQRNVYEQFFLLKYHGGWSFTEAYNLPIGLRNWFLSRLQEQIEEENKQIEKAQQKSKNT